MTKYNEVMPPEQPANPAQPPGVLVGARRLVYAAVGVWGTLGTEINRFYDQCAARGEQLLKPDPKSAASTQPMNPPRFDALLKRGGVVTQAEVAELLQQIEQLSQQIDELAAQRAARSQDKPDAADAPGS
jgi:polyhydroxyalkanoate synthesis regulator phasin